MSTPTIPEPLRRSVAADLRPVSPLQPLPTRLLAAVAIGAAGAAAALVLLHLSLRADLFRMPIWLSWGCTALQLAIGVALIGMALRESVPGRALTRPTIAAALAAGVSLQVFVAVATWQHSHGVPYVPERGLAVGAGCSGHDLAFAVPALLATLWLVVRSLPLRPSVAGLLGGAGAAVAADALNHLVCPVSDLRHVLVWHTGALLALTALGWGAGALWERLRMARARGPRGAP